MKGNLEKNLKRWLKRKVSITLATVVAFAITGGLSYAGTIHPKVHGQSIMLGNKDVTDLGKQTTAIGYDTLATGNAAIAIGGDDNEDMKETIVVVLTKDGPRRMTAYDAYNT